MGKDKLRKFKENETFRCLVQPATSEVLNCDHPLKGRWGHDFFGNANPIILELGCGKGDYTVDLAERNPSFNYIGVDIKGARLWKGAKYAEEHHKPFRRPCKDHKYAVLNTVCILILVNKYIIVFLGNLNCRLSGKGLIYNEKAISKS